MMAWPSAQTLLRRLEDTICKRLVHASDQAITAAGKQKILLNTQAGSPQGLRGQLPYAATTLARSCL